MSKKSLIQYNFSEGTTDPEEFSKKVIESSSYYSQFLKDFHEQFVFQGKTLSIWSNELRVVVPPEPDLHNLGKAMSKVSRCIQIAAHFKGISNNAYMVYSSSNSSQKNQIVKNIIARYEEANITRPGVEAIKSMADSYLVDNLPVGQSTKICKDFWSLKYDSLIEVRKTLEHMQIGVITKLKYEV